MIRFSLCTRYFAGLAGCLCLALCSNTGSGNDNTALIVINEFMVRNTSTSPYVDCLGLHEDWVELYNPGPEAVDMSDYYISDKKDNLLKTRLDDTLIPSGGYYLLWGGDTVCIHNDHIGFSFDSEDTLKKDMILISSKNGEVIDSISFLGNPLACEKDKSYGRTPDGSANWTQQTTATPGASNSKL